MNNFDAFRAITRRYFWDNYISCLTCVAPPIFSGSSFASGDTIDIGIAPIFRAAGPVLTGSEAGGTVTLTWTDIPNAYAAVVYRGNAISGPFSIVASGVIDHSFLDVPPAPGTFFYRVTLIESAFGESEPSNVVSLTV